MSKFIPTSTTSYIKKGCYERQNVERNMFISKSNTGIIQIFKDNAGNIQGRKVTFKHV